MGTCVAYFFNINTLKPLKIITLVKTLLLTSNTLNNNKIEFQTFLCHLGNEGLRGKTSLKIKNIRLGL